MTNVEKILSIARAELGVKESPANSNNVKYNTERYGRAVSGSGYAWCATFVWWVFRHAGLSDLYYGGGKCDYCPTLVNYYKSKGQTVNKPKVGALALYDWGRDGVADHIGIVESVSGNTFVAIEGNTAVGNDSNGGQVMRRTRTASQVLCFAWPYEEATSGGGKVTVQVDLLKRGSVGSSVKALQTLLGLRGYACGYIDGDFGVKTDAAVRSFQKAKQIDIDGIVGKDTWTALLK